MSAPFRVVALPVFDRDVQALARRDRRILPFLERLLEILRRDPLNTTHAYSIKKLVGIKAGDGGQWRLRSGRFRVRYDVIGGTVYLYTFIHRKDTY